jgi:hypothetical protein
VIVHAHAAALLTAAARPGDDDASDAAAQPLITDIKYSGAAWRRLYRQLADVQPQSRDPLVDSATYSGTYSGTYSATYSGIRRCCARISRCIPRSTTRNR